MTRKAAADSIAGKIANAQAAEKEYDTPEGMENLTKTERIVWNQYVKARTGWKEAELRTLHRVVKLETELRKGQREAKKTPLFYEKISGDYAAHPLHAEVRHMQKMLHSELRVIGLQIDPKHAGAIIRSGATAPETTRGKKAPTGPTGMTLVG